MAWYIFYIIKPQGGLDHDVCGLGFSNYNYGNVPTHIIARSWGRDYIIYVWYY